MSDKAPQTHSVLANLGTLLPDLESVQERQRSATGEGSKRLNSEACKGSARIR